MSGCGSTLPDRSNKSAGVKGPQREPMIVSSFTTMGQVSTLAAPWNVDFRTRVPRGTVICWARASPEGEPVASTVRENWFERCARGDVTFSVAMPAAAGEAQFFFVLADHRYTQLGARA